MRWPISREALYVVLFVVGSTLDRILQAQRQLYNRCIWTLGSLLKGVLMLTCSKRVSRAASAVPLLTAARICATSSRPVGKTSLTTVALPHETSNTALTQLENNVREI